MNTYHVHELAGQYEILMSAANNARNSNDRKSLVSLDGRFPDRILSLEEIEVELDSILKQLRAEREI